MITKKSIQRILRSLLPKEKELEVYKDGILGILSKVEIHRADKRMIGHLKTVYRLLDCICIQDVRSVS